MKFDGLDLNLDIEDYGVMLKNLFNGDPILSEYKINPINDSMPKMFFLNNVKGLIVFL